jgi:hypothetical protein
VAGLVALAATAHAAPVAGTYMSVDLGGAMLAGRASQSWAMANNASQGQNDVFNARSWDGSALGTQWGFSCGIQPDPHTVQDDRVSGTGFVVVTNTFSGGTFFLGPGPWGSGTGTLGTAAMTSVVSSFYIDFQLVSVREDITWNGDFDASDCRVRFTSQAGDVLGNTGVLPFPASYPGLLDPACSPSRVHGSWAGVPRITMQITCPVSAEPALWSSVKARYR